MYGAEPPDHEGYDVHVVLHRHHLRALKLSTELEDAVTSSGYFFFHVSVYELLATRFHVVSSTVITCARSEGGPAAAGNVFGPEEFC